MRKELEDVQNGQTLLIEKLIQCCKEVRIEAVSYLGHADSPLAKCRADSATLYVSSRRVGKEGNKACG